MIRSNQKNVVMYNKLPRNFAISNDTTVHNTKLCERKIDVRLNKKQNRAIGESYKKMKKDNSFEVVKKKKMKDNYCLVKKNVKMSVYPLLKLKDWSYLINIGMNFMIIIEKETIY